MRRILLLLVIAVALAGCRGNIAPKAGRTVIAGEVVNMTGGSPATMRINPCDPFAKDERRIVRLSETGGKFHFEHEYLLGNHLTVVYGGSWISLYVEPGDSVFLRIDASRAGRHGDVVITGDNAARNTELNDWERHLSKHYDGNKDLRPYPGKNVSGEGLMDYIKYNTAVLDSVLAVYAGAHKMSDFVYEWARINNRLSMANAIADYHGDDLYDLIKDPYLDMFNPRNFVTMMYSCDVSFYASAVLRHNPEIMKIFDDGDEVEAFSRIISVMEGDAAGIVRDYMIMVMLDGYIDENPALYEGLAAKGKLPENKVLAMRLKERASKVTEVALPETTVKDIVYYDPAGGHKVLPEVDILGHLREKHKGKVIYIDVWAIWCGPCRGELQNHAPAVKAKFKDKDVVFVYLCIDSDSKDWVKSIEDFGIEGENYWFAETQSAMLREGLRIGGIPAYFIIDRQGNLHQKAPRPSDGVRLHEQLNSLLEER